MESEATKASVDRRRLTVDDGNDSHERTPLHVYTEAAEDTQYQQQRHSKDYQTWHIGLKTHRQVGAFLCTTSHTGITSTTTYAYMKNAIAI